MKEGRGHRGWRLAVVLAAIVAGVYAVGAGDAPEVAEYDAPARTTPAKPPADAPLPPAPAESTSRGSAVSAEPPRRRPAPPARASAESLATADSTVARPDTLAVRPHRSDNYGGYRGYGGLSRPSRPRPSGQE